MKPVPRSERQDILFRKKTLRSLEEVERMLIQYVPDKFSGNYVKAAKALGFSLSTLKQAKAEDSGQKRPETLK